MDQADKQKTKREREREDVLTSRWYEWTQYAWTSNEKKKTFLPGAQPFTKASTHEFNPLKTSPKYTRAGVYGKCML